MNEEYQPLDLPENPAETIASDDEVMPNSTDTAEQFIDTPVAEVTPEQIVGALSQEIESLKQQLEEQTQQNDVLKKRHIGLAAEFDNYRKRTAKEKEELEEKVKCRTLTELLVVVDDFERARTQIKPANPGEGTIQDSYQSVYKTLVNNLKKLGVSVMRPEGQPFDPTYHEAMMTEYTNEYPEGTVIEQLRRGYLLNDRVLRHAMVKVAAAAEGDIPLNSDNSSIKTE